MKKEKCKSCPNEAEYDSVIYGIVCGECLDKARTDDLESRKKIEETTDVSLVEKQIILCRVAAPLFGDIVADLYRQEAAKSAAADLKGEDDDPPVIEIDVSEAINFSLGAAAQLMSRAGLPLKL